MSAQNPLVGAELIDCAKSNAKLGSTIAARQCGYGEDKIAFRIALEVACREMGIAFEGLDSLVTGQQTVQAASGIQIAPDNASQL